MSSYQKAVENRLVLNLNFKVERDISFKLCILVYKAIHGLAPGYLDKMCTPVSTVPYLSALRSAAHGDLVVPRTRLQLGNLSLIHI